MLRAYEIYGNDGTYCDGQALDTANIECVLHAIKVWIDSNRDEPRATLTLVLNPGEDYGN